MGVIKYMKENKLTIQINKPINEVFEFTTNPNNTHKWIDSIVTEEINEKPIKVGTIYRNKSKTGNWSEYKCIEFVESERFVLKALNGDYSVIYNYKDLGDSTTEMEYIEHAEGGGFENPFTQEVLEKLKKILET